MTTADPYDYAGPAIEALTEIAKALGMGLPDYEKKPGSLINFGWEAADRINTLTEATGNDPSTPAAVPSPVPTFTSPLPDLDDPTIVAALRLPISVSHLVPLSNLMEKIYGPGLMTPSPGSFFVLRRPDTTTTSEKETADDHA
jgi:hypothetical protein